MKLLTIQETAVELAVSVKTDLTTAQAAEFLGVTPVQLLSLFQMGVIRARRRGMELFWRPTHVEQRAVAVRKREWIAGSVGTILNENQILSARAFTGPVVYFVQAEAGGLIKIGKARHFESRFSTLQAYCPIRLRLVFAMRGTEKDERRLHAKLRSHRAHGEWFHPHEDVLAVVATLKRLHRWAP